MPKLSRKEFLKKSFAVSAASVALPLYPILAQEPLTQLTIPSRENLESDEQFWLNVRQQFALDSNVVNLNNGAVGPQPLVVQQSHLEMYQKSNLAPSHFMWKEVDGKREKLRGELANLLGCDREEVAINRNTTEGLSTVIFGLDLKAGDEVVISDFDYPYALNAWEQRVKRDGIVLKEVKLQLPIEDENEALKLYRAAITLKTKAVHLTHIINWTGQIMPVKELTQMAQELGCQVVVDAAHSLAQIPLSFKEIGCDYMATSLHKWLGAPFGTGALVMKKERISAIWPLHSAWESQEADIRKFEVLGTRSYPAEMAAIDAIEFHKNLGIQALNDRLNLLRTYWVERTKNLQNLVFHTSSRKEFSAAMATFSIDGKTSIEIADGLFESDGLHVGVVNWNGMDGVRVSPHIYTSLEELDRLVAAITKLCES